MPNPARGVMVPSGDNLWITPLGGAEFHTTHWSQVVAARGKDSTTAREALARLCQVYWYPLYAYVRRRGYDVQDAQDLTQSFFACLLDKDYLQQADRERGRFRTFLISSLEHFLDNEWHKAKTQKRGGGYSIISWEAQDPEERYRQEPFHELTPERIYERRWAITLLEKAMTELKQHYERTGKTNLFEELQVYLSGEKNLQSYADVALRLGMSEGAVKVAVHRFRRSFGAFLRAEIAETVSNPEEDIDDELRHALASLS